MEAQYVLTLVHGTWPDAKGWISPGSVLRRELERGLANATFREFSWSGANTHAARTDAGDRLARFLHAGHEQYPDAQHFIIAHSHGGNVASYALRDPAARGIVTGVVTLGTPFINARRRDPGCHADVIAWLTLGIAALFAFVVLDALSLPRVAFAWLIGSVFLMVKFQPALSKRLIDTATLEQADVLHAFLPPGIDESKLLILCARGDEARRWLRAWGVAARAPFVIGWVLLSIVQWGSRSNLPGIVDGLGRSTFHRGLEGMAVFGFDGWALTVGVLILCVIWGPVLMMSSVIRWPGYGREPLLANLLVEIGTDSVPRANDGSVHTAYTFDVPPPSVRSRLTKGHLRHTAICDQPAVVSAISDWIGHGLRPGAPQTSPT